MTIGMDEDCLQLYNIAEGIEYLHSMEPQVIHGDVRGVRTNKYFLSAQVSHFQEGQHTYQ